MPATRAVKSHDMTIQAEAGRVFPLLCPARESEWIQPWACAIVHSRSGAAELDCVFTTSFEDDGPTDTWVVSRHEPPQVVEFVRINAWRAIRYSIRLLEERDGTSRWRWEQVLTALAPEGEALVGSLTDEAYTAEMEMLHRMLDHYLATGTMLRILPG